MVKEIDLTGNVHDLTEVYPELIDILKQEGFLGVANAVLRNTVGRLTTIPQGCRKMGKDLDALITKLEAMGYTVKNIPAGVAGQE